MLRSLERGGLRGREGGLSEKKWMDPTLETHPIYLLNNSKLPLCRDADIILYIIYPTVCIVKAFKKLFS